MQTSTYKSVHIAARVHISNIFFYFSHACQLKECLFFANQLTALITTYLRFTENQLWVKNGDVYARFMWLGKTGFSALLC